MLIILAQGLALACCVLIQCGRLRAAKKAKKVAPKPDPAKPSASCSAVVAKSGDRPTPGSRVCRHSRLPNGMRVATEAFRVDNGDRARLNIVVGAGTRHETEELNGVAHYTEHMILRGPTEELQLKSIELAYDGRLNGTTATEYTEFYMNCAQAADVEQSIALLANLLVNARFQDVIVDRERPIIQSQCVRARTDQLIFSISCMHQVAYHPNPLGLFTCGQFDTNAVITALDIRRFYDAHYKANNTMVTAVGEVEHDEIVKWAECHFQDYARGDAAEAPPAIWKHEYCVCFTPVTDCFFGELAVQGPTGLDFVSSEEGLILQLFNYTSFPSYPDDEEHFNETMSLLAYKEFSSVSQCFFTLRGLHLIIQRWRYLAYRISEAVLESTKEYYKSINREKEQNLGRASMMLNLHMLNAGRPATRDELWSRAISLDRFRAVAKRILIDGRFTLVGYAPDTRSRRIPTMREVFYFLHRSPDGPFASNAKSCV